jgi:hypothetical protein
MKLFMDRAYDWFCSYGAGEQKGHCSQFWNTDSIRLSLREFLEDMPSTPDMRQTNSTVFLFAPNESCIQRNSHHLTVIRAVEHRLKSIE